MRRTAVLLLLAVAFSGCAQYRLASLQDMEIPNYDPRPVVIPETCEGLIARVAAEGMSRLSDAESREALFCQGQMLIRAQEEEAASRRLEAHAEAARFGLQLVTVTVTALVAVLAWLL